MDVIFNIRCCRVVFWAFLDALGRSCDALGSLLGAFGWLLGRCWVDFGGVWGVFFGGKVLGSGQGLGG